MAEDEPAARSRWVIRLHDRVGGGVKRFVRWWRSKDARYLKPLSRERALPWQILAPADYPFFIPLLAAILVVGATVGPRPLHWTAETLGLLGIGLGLLLAVHALAIRFEKVRIVLLGYYLLILALLGSALVLLARGTDTAAADPEEALRVHVGPAVAFLLAAMLVVASWAAGRSVRRVRNEPMPGVLPRVELFQPKSRGDSMGDTPWLSLIVIAFLPVLRYPVQLFLPPALVALLVPSEWVTFASWTFGFAAWAALYLGILFDRLMEILKTVGRLCFIGPQMILSVGIIIVAVGRWRESHYVDYLFDNPGGNWTILSYIFFAYAVAWFYGFWCEILLARRFIRLFSDGVGRAISLPYDFDSDQSVTKVENTGRKIALHGAGRLLVEGSYEKDYAEKQHIPAEAKARTFLTPAECLADIRAQLEDREWKTAWGSDPLPRVRDLQRAVYAYPGVTGLLVILLLGGTLFVSYRLGPQPPELDIVWDTHVNRPLQPLLFREVPAGTDGTACGPLPADAPRIAVAASGGGTRAAVYTAAVLRGLAKADRICNVVLASGVSGGSAALAYFAMNQESLRVPEKQFNETAWDKFDTAMAKSYIQEVLDRASDGAVVFGAWEQRRAACAEFAEKPDPRAGGGLPGRVPIGNLLAESFVCEMSAAYRQAETDAERLRAFGQMQSVPFGLILNTGLTGEFPAATYDEVHTVPEQARLARNKAIRRSDVAGARLILTNLPDAAAARRLSSGEGTRDLRFITINDPQMSVARAAALSANFPPIFIDAAIDERRDPKGDRCARMSADDRAKVCKDVRYWVTDGGTVENRGAVTLYLAVEDALQPRLGEPRLERPVPETWPDLHVVVADVSTASGPYREGVGLSAVQAAGGQMGLALEAELLADLRAAYKAYHAEVVVHELPMPALLRDAIRTHWMMPNGLTLTDPDDKQTSESLSREEGLAVVSSLFTDDASEIIETVRPWLLDHPPRPSEKRTLAEIWAGLLRDLHVQPAQLAAN